MPATHSPLRYPGGKSQLSPLLRRIIFENGLSGCLFLEPFCGGAGAGLRLLFSGAVSGLVLNDKDFGVYALWKTILDEPEGLLSRIEKAELSVDEWRRQGEILENGGNLAETAFAALFLNRCNRSGILKGGCIGGKNQGGRYGIGARFNKAGLIAKIARIHRMRDRIRVHNLDILDFWKEIAVPLAERQRTLAYLDPPYWKQGKALYREWFEKEDHERLADMLSQTDIPFILSYDDLDCVKDLYPFANVGKMSLRHSANRREKREEALILSRNLVFRIPETCQLFLDFPVLKNPQPPSLS